MIAYGIRWPSIQGASRLLADRIEIACSDAFLAAGGIYTREAS